MPPVENRVADWCVHQFMSGRHRYLIFCNTATLFPVVTYARGATDDTALIRRLLDALQLNFAGTGREFAHERWIAPEATRVQFAPIPGPSILGSINELVFLAKSYAAYDDCSPVDLGEKLAETPLGALGMQSPERAFAALTAAGPSA